MAVRKRGGRWYYDFMIKGVRYRCAISEAQTKHQAEQAEARVKLEIFEGKYGGPKGSGSFIEFAEEVFLPWSREHKRSWKDDEYHIETFKSHFRNKCFRDITPMLIEKFKKERRQSVTIKGEVRSAASVNRELACLSKIFSLAIRNNQTLSNPCSQVKRYPENNERVRYLTVEEEAALVHEFTGLRAYLRPIVQVAINSGMRRGEILAMKWSWVDFARGCIHIPSGSTKTRKPRRIPMNAVVLEALLGLKGPIVKSDEVFQNPRTGRMRTDVKKGFRAACDDASLEDFRFHDLRHTFGTRLADTGADPFVIAEVMGHSDLRMTKRYCHATDYRKQGAVDRIASYRGEDCLKIVTTEERKVG